MKKYLDRILVWIVAVLVVACIASSSWAWSLVGTLATSPAGGGGDIAYGTSTGWTSTAAANNTRTLTKTLAVGDLVIVCARWEGVANTISSVSDDATTPNTYSPLSVSLYTGEQKSQMFYSIITTAKTSATITVTWSGSTAWTAIGAFNFTGSFSTVDVNKATTDQAWSGGGTTISPAFTSGTLAQAKEVLVALAAYTSGTTTADAANGWTSALNPADAHAAYKIVNATDSITWLPTSNQAAHVTLSMGSFKAN